MKKITVSLLTALAAVSFVAAAQAETREIDLDSFTRIKVHAPVDIKVTVGKAPGFAMTGDADDLDKLTVAVEGDTLVITKKRRARIDDVMITVATAALEKISVNGSGDAFVTDVAGESFTVGVSGSGNVDFTGRSDKLKLAVSGSGAIEGRDYDAREISVDISGSGDVILDGACAALSLRISGSGEFSGRKLTCADVTASTSGSGDVTAYASKSLRVSTSGSGDAHVYGNPKSIKTSSSGSSELTVHEGD